MTAFTAFIGIDGLRKLATEHPEFDWLRHELEIDRIRCIVSRNGELFTGECTDQEAERKAENLRCMAGSPREDDENRRCTPCH